MKEGVKNLESNLKEVVTACEALEEEYEALEELNKSQWLLLHKIGECTNIKQVKTLLDEHYRL